MSDSNGYDAPGEIAALRRELGQTQEHSGHIAQRLAHLVGTTNTTLDRIATALGRIDRIESKIDALCAHLGVIT